MNMIQVPNCDGHPRYISSDRSEMRIDTDWLESKNACHDGLSWFKSTFTDGCTYLQLRAELAIQNKCEWERWIIASIGGDTATAGNRGTATAGDRGTATAGNSGTATAGNRGTATAGDSGTATAGYRGTATAGNSGTATAGNRGTATAGYRGTATAGEEGIIRILEWDEKQSRYRVITGIIGENGIEANVPYICKDGKLVKKSFETP
jgi:hypothetical protein